MGWAGLGWAGLGWARRGCASLACSTRVRISRPSFSLPGRPAVAAPAQPLRCCPCCPCCRPRRRPRRRPGRRGRARRGRARRRLRRTSCEEPPASWGAPGHQSHQSQGATRRGGSRTRRVVSWASSELRCAVYHCRWAGMSPVSRGVLALGHSLAPLPHCCTSAVQQMRVQTACCQARCMCALGKFIVDFRGQPLRRGGLQPQRRGRWTACS